MNRLRPFLPEALLAAGLFGVVLAVRFPGLGMVTDDYRLYLEPWSAFIAEHGMFSALRFDFANYNVTYLYALTAITWLEAHTPISLIALIKGFSVVFDVVLAYYVARIVALRGPHRFVPLLAGFAVLMLPSVVLNGAYWGQCDTIYAAFAVAGLYHLLRDHPWAGTTLLGVAFALKLQAIFIFPVLLVLLLGRRLPWRCLIAIPGVYLLLALPAWIAGRPFADLLLIYANQTQDFDALTMNAPSVHAFLASAPTGLTGLIRTAGVVVTGAAFVALAVLIIARRLTLDTGRILLLAATSAIMAPFLLPSMHERYFMLAEVLAVAAAFWLPRTLWFVPVLLQAAALATYLTYLLDVPGGLVDLRVPAVLALVALVATGARLLRAAPVAPPGNLPGARRSSEAEPAAIGAE
ncbi:glycosyltransferase 87 family protein [Actinoplanes sp. NPDC051861]|uniref:glycosyltransferase 87 family protein n=1 Tax=Actinoplanes sp. NPDC051861 TaxID=3155170 RepID=UPI0034407177